MNRAASLRRINIQLAKQHGETNRVLERQDNAIERVATSFIYWCERTRKMLKSVRKCTRGVLKQCGVRFDEYSPNRNFSLKSPPES
jgi:hypothetical protein